MNVSFSHFIYSSVLCFISPEFQKEGEDECELSARYQKTLDALSSLITKRSRFVNNNQSHRFRLLFHYLKVPKSNTLKLCCVSYKKSWAFFLWSYESLKGSCAWRRSLTDENHSCGRNKRKGTDFLKSYLRSHNEDFKVWVIFLCKGSTCTFSESILRNYGLRTGLFTSPHLVDVRERFRLNGWASENIHTHDNIFLPDKSVKKTIWWLQHWDKPREVCGLLLVLLP